VYIIHVFLEISRYSRILNTILVTQMEPSLEVSRLSISAPVCLYRNQANAAKKAGLIAIEKLKEATFPQFNRR
jgi:hypothetical protein